MTSAATQELLDDRYGRATRPGRRLRWALLVIFAAVVVGYFAWTTIASGVDTVDVNTTSYEVVDRSTVTVDFQITVRTGARVACAVEAQDTDYGVVGWRVVEYPPSEEHTRAFRVTLPTTAEATTGLASSCWIP